MHATITAHRITALVLSSALLLAGCGGGGGGGSGGSSTVPPPDDPEPTPSTLDPEEDAPGVNLEITGISGSSLAGGVFTFGDSLSVTFSIKKDDGTAWGLSEMASMRILVSGPTFNYQRVLAEKSDVIATAVKVGDATYRYTFATPIPDTYLPPLNDSAALGEAEGEMTGETLLEGTYTVGLYGCWAYTVEGIGYHDAGNAEMDFLFGPTAMPAPHEVALRENCNQCHVELQAHGGQLKDPKLCALCHTTGAEDLITDPASTPGTTIDFKVMIHKLHNGAHLPSVNGVATNTDGSRNYDATPVPYQIIGLMNSVNDFSAVKYPVWPNLTSDMPKDIGYSALTPSQKAQEDAIRGGVTICLKCHGDPDGDGPLPPPADGDNYKFAPGRQACGSCHDDIDWAKPYMGNLSPMPADPGACNLCHALEGDAMSIVDGHRHPLENSAIDAGVVVDVAGVSGGTGAGGNFQAGDRPSLTFSIADNVGNAVDLTAMDSSAALLLGPTINQQVVMSYAGTNDLSLSPYDFSGRLAVSSTTDKGTMSKVVPGGGSTVAETLTVQFSSPTAFTVTGSVSGALGSSALPVSPSTNPPDSSLSALDLTSDAIAQTITVAFSGAQAFTVTGSVTEAMGSGTLPSTVSGSNRFVSTDGKVSFNVSVGTTAFASGNIISLVIVKGSVANPVLFGIVAGRTPFSGAAPAPDRFYYEYVPNAPSYTIPLPMELVVEYLGDGSGSAGQQLTAANLPVYYGRQTLSEVTALANATTLTADVPAQARFIDVVSTTGYTVTAPDNFVVLEPAGGVGVREYLQVGLVDGATRLWFKSPLRYAHAGGAAVNRATLAYRQEGASNQYALDRTTGVVTSVVPWTLGNGVVMTYRTDGRFGYYRHNGDTLQTIYQPPPNDSDTLGPEWGEWQGKSYADGTYTLSFWLSRNLQVALLGELQTYSSTSIATNANLLYGASATTVTPKEIISSSENCNACHNDVQFHGGSRRGVESCLLCHSVAGAEDKPGYDTNGVLATEGVTIDFRTMLHKIHRGAELANASTYAVVGDGAAVSMYDTVEFPAFPGRTKNCIKCHGTDSESWLAPADRDYPTGQTPSVHEWASVCTSCHDDDVAVAHAQTLTGPSGVETCTLCHGSGGIAPVKVVHKPR